VHVDLAQLAFDVLQADDKLVRADIRRRQRRTAVIQWVEVSRHALEEAVVAASESLHVASCRLFHVMFCVVGISPKRL